MPLQIIPANPTFNTLLAQALGQGIGNLGQGIAQGIQGARKQRGVSSLLQQAGISPDQAAAIASSGAEAKDILSNLEKFQAPSQQGQQSTQKVFDEMADLLKSNAPGIGVSPLTKIGLSRQGVENRAYFDTMRARFEATLLPMVNKGTLAKERFNYIMSNIPKASDSQRAIYGKLKALSKDLNLDPQALEGIQWAGDKKGTSETNVPTSSFKKPEKGSLLMQTPDGEVIEVSKSEAKKLESAGAKILR